MRAAKVKTRNNEVSPFIFWLTLEKFWQAWFLKFSFNGALRCFNVELGNSQHNAIGSWGAERSSKFVGYVGIWWSWPLWSGEEDSSCRVVMLQLALLQNKDENSIIPKFQLSSSNSSPKMDQSKKRWKLAICCILHPLKAQLMVHLREKCNRKKKSGEHKRVVLEVKKCYFGMARPIGMSQKPRKKCKLDISKFAYMQNFHRP